MIDQDYIIKYIDSFTRKKMIEPSPGEHHFVSMCLLPILLKNNLYEEIKYINPDGMKGYKNDRFLCDMTISKEEKRTIGVEVKYSKNNTLKFTKVQWGKLIRDKEAHGGNEENIFLGVLALINANNDEARVVFISLEELISVDKLIEIEKKNSGSKYLILDVIVNKNKDKKKPSEIKDLYGEPVRNDQEVFDIFNLTSPSSKIT